MLFRSVEINDLVAERTIFRNMSNYVFVFGGRDYNNDDTFWLDAQYIVETMESSGEFLRFEQEVVNYIRQHPDNVLPYAVDDEGIVTIPLEHLELVDYSQAEYERILSTLKKPVGVTSDFVGWYESEVH